MARSNGNGKTADPLYVSRAQATSMAQEQAEKMLGVSLEDAFAMLDRGELAGTAAEAEFSMLRFLVRPGAKAQAS